MLRIWPITYLALSVIAAASSRAIADEPATRPAAHVNHAGLVKLTWQLAGETSAFNDRSISETIELFHSLGIHHLELASQPPPDNIDSLLTKLKSLHMDVVSYGVADISGNEADLRKLFDLAKQLKAKTIVANPSDDSLEMLDKLANEYRINIAVINPPKPGNHWNPDDELRLLAGRSGRIGFCADVAAWKASGLSAGECAHKLAGHIMEVRLNDIDDRQMESDVLAELKQHRFKGICALGYDAGRGDERVDRFTLSINTFSDIVTELVRAK